jgi:hypothetical protein
MKLVRSICLCFFLLGSLLAPASRPAIAQSAQPPQTTANGGDAPYLLLLPMPNIRQADLPGHLSPSQAKSFAEDLFIRQAQPLLGELSRLASSGLVSDVTLDPAEHAISLQINDQAALKQVQALAGSATLLPRSEVNRSCASKAAQALSQEVFALSRAGALPQNTTGKIVINVDTPAQAEGLDGYSIVEGSTTPNTAVSMRLLRGKDVVGTKTGTSDPQGLFTLYPDWQGGGCGSSSSLSWVAIPGDVVEITAGGATVSTVVANLTAWADPQTNIVSGATDANRTVKVDMLTFATTACWEDPQHTILSQKASTGKFTIDFSKKADFNRRAWALVYSQDANGNSTYVEADAFYLSIYMELTAFGGVLKPLTPYSVTLKRAGKILSTVKGDKTDSQGYFTGIFDESVVSDFLTGDVLDATDGTNTVSMTLSSLSGAIDPDTDQVSGSVSPGWVVFPKVNHQANWPTLNGCQADTSGCKSAAANSSGNYTVTYTGPFDILPGDSGSVQAFDPQGNDENSSVYSGQAIFADLSANMISGFWDKTDVDLSITLEKADHSQHEDLSAHTRYATAQFTVTPHTLTVETGDAITITAGSQTQSMTVADLSGVFDTTTKHLSGSAPNTHLVANMLDYDGIQSGSYRCLASTVSGGAFDFDFSAASVVGMNDHAYLSASGPDGHEYTVREVRVAGISIFSGVNFEGYTQAPAERYTMTIQQPDGTPVTTSEVRTSSDRDGYFVWSALPAIQPGQKAVLKTEAGAVMAEVTMPALTVNIDPQAKRVYGQGPKNSQIDIRLNQESATGFSQLVILPASTDASGNYSLLYADAVSAFDCTLMGQKSCLFAQLDAFDERENMITIGTGLPDPVGKDAAEPDDTVDTAQPLVGGALHTFDASTDVDWFSFSFDDKQAGRVHMLKTVVQGPAVKVVFTVYASDRTTVIAADTHYSNTGDARISFTPETPGTYYLKVTPFADNFTGKCGSFYALRFNYDTMLFPIFKNSTGIDAPNGANIG